MITQEKLHKLFTYNMDTGECIRNITRSSRAVKGYRVGHTCKTSGYMYTIIDGTSYLLHRLIFLYIEGEYPDYVDHIDGNKYNNKWSNLRKCNQTENRYNSSIMSNNTTGVKGISFTDGRAAHYRAGVKGKEGRVRKCFSINIYGSKEKALEAATLWVIETRNKLHGDFANHG